jgi:hypothetical protein
LKKLFAIAILVSNFVFAQNTNDNTSEKPSRLFKKGSVMLFWGWNQAKYSKSDIHFKGKGYDFELDHVVAHDRQTPFEFGKYFNPGSITVPQVNYRITYFPVDRLGITLGMDHMKYVVDQEQTVDFRGNISDPKYASMIKNGKVDLTDANFLTFEHTDGLNYINVGAQKYHEVMHRKHVDLYLSYGGGFGALLPKSNVMLMGNERSDRFHLAGFGVDMRMAASLILAHHIVLQAEGKLGYINMADIKTTLNDQPDHALQDFVFAQYNIGIGYTFNTTRRSN